MNIAKKMRGLNIDPSVAKQTINLMNQEQINLMIKAFFELIQGELTEESKIFLDGNTSIDEIIQKIYLSNYGWTVFPGTLSNSNNLMLEGYRILVYEIYPESILDKEKHFTLLISERKIIERARKKVEELKRNKKAEFEVGELDYEELKNIIKKDGLGYVFLGNEIELNRYARERLRDEDDIIAIENEYGILVIDLKLMKELAKNLLNKRKRKVLEYQETSQEQPKVNNNFKNSIRVGEESGNKLKSIIAIYEYMYGNDLNYREEDNKGVYIDIDDITSRLYAGR